MHAGVSKMLSHFCWSPGCIWACRERTLHPCFMSFQAHGGEMRQVTKLKGVENRADLQLGQGWEFVCVLLQGTAVRVWALKGHSSSLALHSLSQWQPQRAAATIKPQCWAQGSILRMNQHWEWQTAEEPLMGSPCSQITPSDRKLDTHHKEGRRELWGGGRKGKKQPFLKGA